MNMYVLLVQAPSTCNLFNTVSLLSFHLQYINIENTQKRSNTCANGNESLIIGQSETIETIAKVRR